MSSSEQDEGASSNESYDDAMEEMESDGEETVERVQRAPGAGMADAMAKILG
jgi:hypothetical protein